MANLRDHVVIVTLVTENEGECSGSGPSYTVTYDTGEDATGVDVGDHAYVEKREAGAGGGSSVLSTYVYVITDIAEDGSDASPAEMTLKYIYDTEGTGDDSPCDLPKGTGSSGSPAKADHKIVRILGPAYEMFVE